MSLGALPGGAGIREGWDHALAGLCHACPAAAPSTRCTRRQLPPSLPLAPLSFLCSWFTNLAKAADAVGIPLCASLAVVDLATGEVVQSQDFHTGEELPPIKKSSP